jgi:hypothetical protein
MTEQEWLASREPRAMLAFLLGRGKATDRKVRLFGCACCRLIWDLLPDPRNRDMVLAIEDHPDGSFSDPDLDEAISASSLRECELSSNPVYWVAKYLGRGFYKMTAGTSALTVALKAAATVPGGLAREAHMAEQADRLRDILGTLSFRPLPPLPPAVLAWHDGTIPRIAEGIYEDRKLPEGTLDNGRLAILADALLDAGCQDEALMQHCREPDVHVRGCWAVDLVLGKA